MPESMNVTRDSFFFLISALLFGGFFFSFEIGPLRALFTGNRENLGSFVI